MSTSTHEIPDAQIWRNLAITVGGLVALAMVLLVAANTFAP